MIPAETDGRFRRLRNRVYFVLLIVFLGLPWLKINGLQAVLLDIPNRRFALFGKLFLAHDAPLVFPILTLIAMALAFMTAVWGRVWCGWACPQTVFIDGVYRKLEIWIEGNYLERRRLHRSGLTPERALKSSLKWLAYFVVSSLIAHSFIAYFTGADELIQMISGPPAANRAYFLIVSGMTALLMFNFGWFREQFCTIMCPYGRFQSVLMDERSLAIVYDEARGEPRKSPSLPAGTKRGACVSCNRCVEVCPAGIDIRKGIQMECIACTACIDACDAIMKKVNQPPGLISYRSESGKPVRVWRPRTAAYFAIGLLCVGALALSYGDREAYSVSVLRAKDTPFQVLSEERVLNHLKVMVFNQSLDGQEFTVSLAPALTARGYSLIHADGKIALASGEKRESHVFITFPAQELSNGKVSAQLTITESRTGSTALREVTLVGPDHGPIEPARAPRQPAP